MEGRRCKIFVTDKMGRGTSSVGYNYRRQNCRSSNKQILNQMGYFPRRFFKGSKNTFPKYKLRHGRQKLGDRSISHSFLRLQNIFCGVEAQSEIKEIRLYTEIQQ